MRTVGATWIAIVQPMTALATDLVRDQAYIDGAWGDADSGATFPVVDPATGTIVANVPRHGAAETAVRSRLRSARFPPGSTGLRRIGPASCAVWPI
jgi:hypothetical protein